MVKLENGSQLTMSHLEVECAICLYVVAGCQLPLCHQRAVTAESSRREGGRGTLQMVLAVHECRSSFVTIMFIFVYIEM